MGSVKGHEKTRDEVFAHAPAPVMAPVREELIESESDGDWVYVSNINGEVGPLHRWVGVGDLLRADEVSAQTVRQQVHVSAFRLPAGRGIVAYLFACLTRTRFLESVLVDGDAAAIEAERARILHMREMPVEALANVTEA